MMAFLAPGGRQAPVSALNKRGNKRTDRSDSGGKARVEAFYNTLGGANGFDL